MITRKQHIKILFANCNPVRFIKFLQWWEVCRFEKNFNAGVCSNLAICRE